jgi:hypothetical protein
MPLKFRAAILFVFALALAAQSGFTQTKDDPIIARMKKDVFFLASEECEGRGVGTNGLDLAAHYVAAQFKKAGLKPGGVNNTYFQPFIFSTGAQADGESTCVITGPTGEKFDLKQGKDFQVIGTSGPGKVNAPLVFAGYGVTSNRIAYDDFAGIDVKNKAIITLRRLPRFSDKEKQFDGSTKDEINALAALDSKQNRGEAKHAAAVILVNDASEMPNDNLTAFQVTKGISTVSMPYVQIKRSVLDEILKSSTGASLADTEKMIDDNLRPRSAALTGWNVQLDVRIKRNEIPLKNVIATVEGKGPLANEIVVVGAHYDHVGYGEFGSLSPKDRGKIHFGADDNGSGTTSMMELARRFAQKKTDGRRMVFMAFTAEERGLIGSRHYTRVNPLFPLKDTSAMFNLDMVGRVKELSDGAKPKLLVEGFNSAKEFDELVDKMNPGFDIVKKNSRGFFSSDQYNFYLQKIPVLFFWTGEHSEYHRPTDIPEKINVSGMKRIADYAERVIEHLRTEPKRPEYMTVQVKFGPNPNPGGKDAPRLGIFPDLDFEGPGVRVAQVSKGGLAESAGFKNGDIILQINGKKVANLDAYRPVLAMHKLGDTIEIQILRDKQEMKLKVTLK